MTKAQKDKQKEQLIENLSFEQFKNQVTISELEARHNEAIFKKMDFYVKAYNITPIFLDIREKEREEYNRISKATEQEIEEALKKTMEPTSKIITEL